MKNSKKEYITPGTTVVGVDFGSLMTDFGSAGGRTVEGAVGAKRHMAYRDCWYEEEEEDEEVIVRMRSVWDD